MLIPIRNQSQFFRIHGHVLRDIESTSGAVNIDALRFEGIYKDAHEREKPCCYLPKLELDSSSAATQSLPRTLNTAEGDSGTW